jgi:hypothetical protein
MIKSITRISTLVLLMVLIAVPSDGARRKKQQFKQLNGWFISTGISAFETAGTGDLSSKSGDVEYNHRRFNAYGLVNHMEGESFGLGWETRQLPGVKLGVGYRHNRTVTSRFEIFWALSKTSTQYGNAPPESEAFQGYYLRKQYTDWRQKSFSFMVDLSPFEPLPFWSFTVGAEYSNFISRLEFNFDAVNLPTDESQWRYESYQDGGSSLGLIVGTGIKFQSSDSYETALMFKYSWIPLSDDFYGWESDINIGGLAIEVMFRIFLSDK